MPRLTGFDPVPIRGPSALPFIGVHVNAVRLMTDPVGVGLELRRDFGDIAAVADHSPALVCAFGAERNREVLSNPAVFENDNEFFLRSPPGSGLEKFTYSLPFQQGETHRRHRRLLMPAFQKAAIDGYAPGIVAVTNGALERWPVGQTADVARLVGQLVKYVAVECLFGLDWRKGDRGLGDLIMRQVDLLTSPLSVVLPYRIPGTPFAQLLETSAAVVDKLRELIAEKRAQPDAGRDALGLIVRANDADASKFSDDEMIGEAGLLFVAGHDTQAKTLAWTLFLLDQHPLVLGSLLDEIDGVLRGGPPTVEAVGKMALLDRVIKESMRVLPSVPVLFIRVSQSEARLGSYTLPAGANVVLSPFVTQRDPELYPEPARFLPERWETIQPTAYEYLPFGAGARMCLGGGFATLALRLMLVMILQRYRLSLAHGARVSRRVTGNILGPKYGLPMLVAPQDRRFSQQKAVRGDIPPLLDLS